MKIFYTLNVSVWRQKIKYSELINKTLAEKLIFFAALTVITGLPVFLSAQPCSVPAISNVSITQPSCGSAFGMILINAEGESLEYSINNGNTWGAGNGFANLSSGTYNIKVRSNASCVIDYSANPIVIDAVPGPFTIMADQGLHGTILPAGTVAVNCGYSKTYSIIPLPCYNIADVIVDGVSVGSVSSYTFDDVATDHTIYASFTAAAAVTPVIHGPANVCAYAASGGQAIYTVDSIPNAVSYTWGVSPTMMILSGQGSRSITVGFNTGFVTAADKRITVTANSPCDYNNYGIYYLRAQLPSTPLSISGNTNVCSLTGTTSFATYAIPRVPGASSYIWTAQAGTTTISHPNGNGAADTVIQIIFNNNFSNSPVQVQAVNDCGVSSVRSLMVQRNTVSTPSLINGPTNVCGNVSPNGSPATYIIRPITGANSYVWSVPAGSTLTHTNAVGINDTIIQVLFPTGFTGGAITVMAANSCGTSNSRTLNVTRLMPSAPGPIDTLPGFSCPGRTSTYKIQSMPFNCNSVQWTVPSQGYIVSGQGTTTISVAYPPTAVTGTVSATSTNNCGVSSIRVFAVKLDACIEQPPMPPAPRSTGETLRESLYPNPSSGDFNLRVDKSLSSHPIIVTILDMQGVELKKLKINSSETVRFGSTLQPGRYMVEINDGASKITKTILKF